MRKKIPNSLMLPFALLATLFVSLGCSKEGDKAPQASQKLAEAFALSFCEAILNDDEDAFVKLHLQKGDQLPDGYSIYVDPENGKDFEADWPERVKKGFKEARQWVERKQAAGEKLEIDTVLKMRFPEESNEAMMRQGRIFVTFVSLKAGDKKYVVELGQSVMTQRGRAMMYGARWSTDPSVRFTDWETYEREAAEAGKARA